MSAVDDMAAPLLGPTDVARGATDAGPDLEAGGGQRLGHASLPHKLDLAAFRKSSGDLQVLLAGRKRALYAYYTQQNELIEQLLEAERISRGESTGRDEDEEEQQVQRALNLSFASNCVLLVVRVVLAFLSGSLSMLVATLDAVLDVVSSAVMFFAASEARRHNKYRYPAGKERLEPLGVVVFSIVMGTAAVSVIIQGIKSLLSRSEQELPMVWLVVGGTVGVVAMKLALYLFCRGSANPAVQAFALDHLNDVLVNSVGLAGALMGSHVAPYWDPIFAIALSFWVVWAWGGQARVHILNLVGLSAPPALLQKLTYLSLLHDPRVEAIDTVRAFSLGNTFVAEVDIVLPPDMPLRDAHDIGEDLQFKLERITEVGRAYVHLDYEHTHTPERG